MTTPTTPTTPPLAPNSLIRVDEKGLFIEVVQGEMKGVTILGCVRDPRILSSQGYREWMDEFRRLVNIGNARFDLKSTEASDGELHVFARIPEAHNNAEAWLQYKEELK